MLRRVTQHHAPGTQGELIDAAIIAALNGNPINRLLTIKTQALRDMEIDGGFSQGHPADAVGRFIDLLRRWINKRCVYAAIWSREYGKTEGEHLHIGLHLPDQHDLAFAAQLADWTGEAADPGKTGKSSIRARSALGSWQLDRCIRSGTTGTGIAAYIGKDEPTHLRTGWGKVKPNHLKRCVRHPCTVGPLEGKTSSGYRSGISRGISPASAHGKAVLAEASDRHRKIDTPVGT